MVGFFTYWKSPETSIDEVNSANTKYKAVQFSVRDERIWAFYYMSHHSGLDTRQLIVMVRHFGSICSTVFRESKQAAGELEGSD